MTPPGITMVDSTLLPLLHLADTAFPTGGYAHSFGLETYCQDGRVVDADALAAFLTMHLEGAAGPTRCHRRGGRPAAPSWRERRAAARSSTPRSRP